MRNLRSPCPWVVALLAGCTLPGCATEDLQPDFARARGLVRDATGEEAIFDPQGPLLSEDEIRDVLVDGLTLDEGLQLALRNNRRLQAGFMELGVSRADYVQAGLLRNPSLGVSLLLPSGGGRTRLAAELAQDIMDLWRIPSRQLAAAAGMEQQVFDLARFAGDLVAQTKEVYFDALTAHEARAIASEAAGLARQTLGAVQQRVAAGVATETEAALVQALASSAELDARRAEGEVLAATRRLGGLLSLQDDLLGVPLRDALPTAPRQGFDREALVQRGRAARMDVRAAAAALAAADARVDLERKRSAPQLAVGIAAERPEGGSSTGLLVGPAATVEIPLFDRNEAQISRAEFEREEARKTHEAMLAEVGQAIRAAVDRADLAARSLAFVEDELLPQSTRTVSLAQQAFDLGDVTLLTVLQAQRMAIEARLAGLQARREAAVANAELERSMGGPLSPGILAEDDPAGTARACPEP